MRSSSHLTSLVPPSLTRTTSRANNLQPVDLRTFGEKLPAITLEGQIAYLADVGLPYDYSSDAGWTRGYSLYYLSC